MIIPVSNKKELIYPGTCSCFILEYKKSGATQIPRFLKIFARTTSLQGMKGIYTINFYYDRIQIVSNSGIYFPFTSSQI